MSELGGFAAPPSPGHPVGPRPAPAPAAGSDAGIVPPAVPRRRPRRRRGVVVAWTVGALTALAIGGGVAADVVLTASADAAEPVERGFTGRLHSVQAGAGLCLADVPGGPGPVGSLSAVPCDTPHRAQTIASTLIPGEQWPGDQAVAEHALRFCSSQVARTVPPELAPSIRWRAWVPTEQTWDREDRMAVCVVVADAPLTGPVDAAVG